MNIAQRISSYFENEDFKGNYYDSLLVDTHNCQNRIIEICQSYEFELKYGKTISLTSDQAETVYQFILDNIEDFISDFHGYYVGNFCVDSIEYGEQYEDLTSLTNHQTNKPYSLSYLKNTFNQDGWIVNGKEAFYLLSGGLKIDLIAENIPLLKEALGLKEDFIYSGLHKSFTIKAFSFYYKGCETR